MVYAQHILIAIRRGDAESRVPEVRQEPQSCLAERIGFERSARQTGHAAHLLLMAQGRKRSMHLLQPIVVRPPICDGIAREGRHSMSGPEAGHEIRQAIFD